MRTLVRILSNTDDPDCFFIELMGMVARAGFISLTLLKRIMDRNESVGLSWMCDLLHPVVDMKYAEDMSAYYIVLIN